MVLSRRRRARGEDDIEFGYPGNSIELMPPIEMQALAMGEQNDVPAGNMMPDWDDLAIRVRIPCRGTDKFEWHNTGLLVSLG